jgi:Zn-dependent peptidase ImmA (M78 family)
MTFREIERKTLNLLQKISSSSTINVNNPPIPVEKIAENFFGFRIVQGLPSKNRASGMIQLSQKIIAVDPKEPVYRQRFSIAHEIGHWVLHAKDFNGQKIFRFLKNQERIETEANAFAGAFLMPSRFVYESLLKNLSLIANFQTEWLLKIMQALSYSQYKPLNKLLFAQFFPINSASSEKKENWAKNLVLLIPKMAEEFKVSKEALSVRLRILGLLDPIFNGYPQLST